MSDASGVDMPTGVGWWAFEGDHVIIAHHPTEVVMNIAEWNCDTKTGALQYRVADSRWPHNTRLAYFMEEWQGKWYKITMPWEAPATPTLSAQSVAGLSVATIVDELERLCLAEIDEIGNENNIHVIIFRAALEWLAAQHATARVPRRCVARALCGIREGSA